MPWTLIRRVLGGILVGTFACSIISFIAFVTMSSDGDVVNTTGGNVAADTDLFAAIAAMGGTLSILIWFGAMAAGGAYLLTKGVPQRAASAAGLLGYVGTIWIVLGQFPWPIVPDDLTSLLALFIFTVTPICFLLDLILPDRAKQIRPA